MASRVAPAASRRSLYRAARSRWPRLGTAAGEAPTLATQNLVVEFLGIPGSGKSTLARALAARFEQQGYRTRAIVMQRPTIAGRLLALLCKFWNFCRLALRYRHAFVDVRRALTLFPQNKIFSHSRLRLYLSHLIVMRSGITSDCSTIILFDQGIVQAIYSLSLFSPLTDDSRFIRVLKTLPTPDILITLDVPIFVALERLMQRRGHDNFSRITYHDSDLLKQSLMAIGMIESLVRTNGCRVIHYRMDDSASIERSTNELFQALWPVVSGAPSKVGASTPRQMMSNASPPA